MAGTRSITRKQGDTFKFNFRAETGNGVPINLTGYTIKLQVRESAGSPTAFINLSTGNGITINGADNNRVSCYLQDLSNVPVGRWVYDVEFTEPSGDKFTWLEGPFICTDQVSV